MVELAAALLHAHRLSTANDSEHLPLQPRLQPTPHGTMSSRSGAGLEQEVSTFASSAGAESSSTSRKRSLNDLDGQAGAGNDRVRHQGLVGGQTNGNGNGDSSRSITGNDGMTMSNSSMDLHNGDEYESDNSGDGGNVAASGSTAEQRDAAEKKRRAFKACTSSSRHTVFAL